MHSDICQEKTNAFQITILHSHDKSTQQHSRENNSLMTGRSWARSLDGVKSLQLEDSKNRMIDQK